MTIPRKIAITIRGSPQINSCLLIVTLPSEYMVFVMNLSRKNIIAAQKVAKTIGMIGTESSFTPFSVFTEKVVGSNTN